MENISIAIIFLLVLIFLNSYLDKKIVLSSNQITTSTPTFEPSPTPTYEIPTYTPTPTQIIYKGPTPTAIPWGTTIKLDSETSASYFAPDDHMSTTDELNQAMNQYRKDHNLPTLNFDSTLCNIAQIRAGQLKASGQLSHDGFSDLAHNQQVFSSMDEVIFGGNNPVAGVHIVEWGWDKSLTGHHEAISDTRWHDGCGATAGLFAVFEFGAR